MAITIAPTLKTITSFDAEKDKIIQFSIDGMNIVPTYVNVTIKDNATGNTVYTNTTTINLSNLTHTIVKNSLQNNKYYKCYITIVSSDNEVSPVSNTVTFYCIKTPIFQFINIPSLINISSLTALLSYEQTGTTYDPLSSYIVRLYNSQNNIVFDSSTIYVQNNTELKVKIENIEDGSYTIKAIGETANGLIITTEESFVTSYKTPTTFSSLLLDNLFDKGQIKLTSNIVGLIGTINGQAIYIDNDMIDLRGDNVYVTFDKGFLIADNFYIKLWVKDLKVNTRKPFVTVKNNSGNRVEFFMREGYFSENNGVKKAFIEVRAIQNDLIYMIHSNYIDIINKDVVYCIGVKKNKNLYQAHISEVQND